MNSCPRDPISSFPTKKVSWDLEIKTQDQNDPSNQIDTNNNPIILHLNNWNTLPILPARIGEKCIEILIDTGSTVTLVQDNLVDQSTLEPLRCKAHVTGIEGTQIQVLGKCVFNIEFAEDNHLVITAMAIQGIPFDILLGNDVLSAQKA